MDKKTFAIGDASIDLATVNVLINGVEKEVIPAFTKFSTKKSDLSQIKEAVDWDKLPPTVFAFAETDIFHKEEVQLTDYYGTEIPAEIENEATVLVFLQKSDNLNLLEDYPEPLPSEVVNCDNVADFYSRVATSFSLSKLPQKSEWIGLCEATTADEVLLQIKEFVEDHKVNGTVAQAYFGLRLTISELKKAALKKDSPIAESSTFRTKEQATQLYDAMVAALKVKGAGQTRYIKAVNTCIKNFSFDAVLEALGDLTVTECSDILKAPSEEKASVLSSLIGAHVGKNELEKAA